MEVLKFGFKYWKRNLPEAVIIQLVSYIAIIADLLIPLVSEMFIDYVICDNKPANNGIFSFMLSGKYGEVHSMKLFFSLAVIFIIFLVARIILIYIKNTNNQRLGLKLERDLRVVTFRKLMELDSESISQYNTGELLTTMNSDTIMYKELFCRMIPNILDSVFVLITCACLLSLINISLLAIPLIMMPIFVIALRNFKRAAKVNYSNIRKSNSEMSLNVQENIEAVRLVRSFTNEEVEKRKFDKNNDKVRESYINQINLSAKFEVIFSSIKQISYIGTIAVSTILVIKGYMLVGYLVACSNYVLKIMDHISQINNTLFQMQQQFVSGQKMMNFISCESKITDGGGNLKISGMPNIRVKNAYLTMEGNEVLKDVSLDIPYGKKIGIVGGTGSGKSVLLESLVRIHDLTSGTIEINGKDIRDYSLKSLRNKFSYVFQEVFLFSNTIDSNIAYAEPEIEKEHVVKAAKHAQAHNFVKKLPVGYETIVGEKGIGISGGQKQRVSIARALLKDAPVLILDDSTSALDVDTEKKFLADIKKYYPDKTILISAHRMSSVIDCDEIIYMLDGIILERGTFDELMKLGGHFAKVYKIQEAQRKSVIDFDALAAGEV
ncbi:MULTISPECIES: ABC transporter ATP-binding protein [unclassified Clostridium]|uniref:ABC transporter ATP-binding protein n=1 Tax=unclassified Clostridium TaxID=2614128 RepID=UPI00029825FE|nr:MULTISPECIES: ABC transporter ATP-binding protein [unclassified Clostridium]EKQ53614.1 MAG: ABC-type multidrug transport system, ATPase and permease component [Clostridium sp. Maddingley MBC34-26]